MLEHEQRLDDLLGHGNGHCGSIGIAALGFIHNHQNHVAGIINGEMGHETADPGPRDIDAPFGLLGGAGFTPNAISRNAGALTAALLNHTLHPAHHRLGDPWIEKGNPTVRGRAGEGIPGAQPPGDVGAHQATAIGEHGVQLQQFQRR